MSTDDDTGSGERTFTKAEFARELAKQVREALAREREKYADYDDLKAQAAEAGKSKSAIERIEAKLDEATKRADKAEEANMRREVADELGLSARQARRLSGKTRDELLADGREMIEDLGIKPKGKASTRGDDTGNGDDDNKPSSSTRTRDDEDEQQQRPEPQRRRKPIETLRNGAPASRQEPEETDPLKLVEKVRRY